MEQLKKQHKTVCFRAHPESDNFFGVKARQFLLSSGKSAHFASALFYMIDVLRSVAKYSWRREDYIVFVRYLMGTAYLPSPLHKIGYRFFAIVVPRGDAMFFLDLKPEEAYRRMAKRNVQEMFEGVASLKKVRAKALALARIGEWVIVDSSQPTEKVAVLIQQRLLATVS
jgi:dTMP kinase